MSEQSLPGLPDQHRFMEGPFIVAFGYTKQQMLDYGRAAQRLAHGWNWREVSEDGLPPIDGVSIFIGVNINGYVGAFNDMNPDGLCLSGTSEGCTAVMSGLKYWLPYVSPMDGCDE